MARLPEAVLRWARYQRELGIDEVVLDERLVLPTASTEAPAPVVRAAPRREVPASRPAAASPLLSPSRSAPVAATPPQVPRTATQTRPARAAIPVFGNVSELSGHAAGCTRCVLHERRRGVLAAGGPERSAWAVLTLYAWGEDHQRGGILSGDYATPFLELARGLGLPEPAVAGIFACTPDDPSDTTIQGFTEAVRCRGHWLQRLKLSGARAVLVLDHKATLLARGPSSPVEWPAFRGTRWELDGIPAVSTHHPTRLSRNPALRAEVESDLRQVLSIAGAS